MRRVLEGHQTSFDHSHPGFKLQYSGKETKCDSSPVSDCLSHLMEMIVWSTPVEDPHVKQRQQGRIVNLPPIDHTKPFGPVDHMSP